MPRKKIVAQITNADRVAALKIGDIIFTSTYGQCTVDYIDRKQVNPGVYVKDEKGASHFVNARDIIWEE